MRVAVVGAGAVGGTFAALLHRAGHDVEVTARGAHADAIERYGLRLTGVWGEHVARVPVGPRLTRRPELTIVATKAMQAEQAMAPAARLLLGVPVLVIQNGLGSTETAQRALPESDVLGGLSLFAASHLSPGDVSVTAPGRLYLEKNDLQNGLATLFVERVLSEALPVVVVDDFVGAQWTKLFINQVNALPAITGLSVQEVIAHDGLRRIMTGGMTETVRTALAHRVRFEPMQGLSHPLLRMFAAAPYPVRQLLPRSMARRMGPVPNPGSTLQSVRRGQLTEIDHLNGAVVAAADAVGVATPVNSALVELVHRIEGGTPFLPPGDVVRVLSARQ